MLQFHFQRTAAQAAVKSLRRSPILSNPCRAVLKHRGVRVLYTQRPSGKVPTCSKSASKSATTTTTRITKTGVTTAARPQQLIPSSTATTAFAASSGSQLPFRLAAPIGGFAGLISAMTGVGGGMVLIPGLAKFTKLPQQAINGTSIGAVTISATVGAMNYIDMGSCNIPLAMLVTIPSIFFTRYGVQMAHRLPSNKLSKIVGLAMLMSTPFIVLKNKDVLPKWTDPERANPLDLQFYGRQTSAVTPSSIDASLCSSSSVTAATMVAGSTQGQPTPQAVASSAAIMEQGQQLKQLFVHRSVQDPMGFARANAQYALAGAFAGFLSGLCGLGGGVLMTAYLTTVSDLPQSTVIGTSLLSIVPTAASSAFFNFKRRSMHIPTVLSVGSSLTLGVYVTSKFVTHKVNEDTLRNVLAGALGTAAIIMMRRRV